MVKVKCFFSSHCFLNIHLIPIDIHLTKCNSFWVTVWFIKLAEVKKTHTTTGADGYGLTRISCMNKHRQWNFGYTTKFSTKKAEWLFQAPQSKWWRVWENTHCYSIITTNLCIQLPQCTKEELRRGSRTNRQPPAQMHLSWIRTSVSSHHTAPATTWWARPWYAVPEMQVIYTSVQISFKTQV